MDCVDARLKFIAALAGRSARGRPSHKMGLGKEEFSLRTLSAVIRWHPTKFNVSRWSREQVMWEMSVKPGEPTGRNMKPPCPRIAVVATMAVFAMGASAQWPTAVPTSQPRSPDGRRYMSQPLVTSIYTADPSAHVFGGRIYIYASHDIDDGPPLSDVEPFKGSEGNAFKMRDYRVLSMDRIGGEVKG